MTAGITRGSYVVMLVSPVDVYTGSKTEVIFNHGWRKVLVVQRKFVMNDFQTPCDE